MLISFFSSSLVGHYIVLSLKCLASGTLTGFALSMLNLLRAFSMYFSCDSHINFLEWSLITFIPRICLAGPKSFKSNESFHLLLEPSSDITVGKIRINSPLWCRYKIGTCGSNKQIIENIANTIITENF